MPDSVSDQLSKLTFTSSPVETLYLNESRTRDDFLGQIGAIESFTRTATREGQLNIPLPFLSVGGAVGANAGVTWTLSDPTAQALVLRAALEDRGQLTELGEAAAGAYVLCQGRGLLSRPGMLDTEHRASLPLETYEVLEAERAQQEQVLRMIEQPTATMWLLTVQAETVLAAAILDNRWLRPGLPSWLGGEHRWSVFARVRGESQSGHHPLLAAIHVTVTW